MKNPHIIDTIDFKGKFFSITLILALVGYITQILLSGWISIFGALFDVVLISLTISFILWFLGKRKYSFRIRFFRSFLIFSAITWGFSLVLWLGSFLSNSFPWALSKITLSNGEKTIVYYQMSHIATERYYKEIHTELLKFAGNGYKFYLEGVLPGTKENQDRLEKALGMRLSSGTYEDISSILGMASQDETLYDGIDKNALIHADLSVDDIAANLSSGSIRSENPIDIAKEFDTIENSSNNKWAISYIFRWLLNVSLRYTISSDGMLDILDPETVQALLDKRNKKVVDTFLENNTKDSVFLYGALHFDGIYAYLKSKDTKWEIQSLEPIYPYVP